MKKATIVVSDFYKKNRIFDLQDPISNRDNCLHFFYSLREELALEEIELSTQDITPIAEAEFVFFNDICENLPAKKKNQQFILLLFESEVIKPTNWDRSNHKAFDKVFTWHDAWVDNKKYFKFNFSHAFTINKDKTNRKFLTLLSGNKRKSHPLELYSERIRIIRWLERKIPNSFDLYGVGWDKFSFEKFKLLNRFRIARFFNPYTSYKGSVKSKKEIFSRYDFAICFENAKGIPGYITEKIFDCFFAGCIPIYWGAPNIEDHIPADTFIDYTEFNSDDELLDHLVKMTDSDKKLFRNNIENFLLSHSSNQFKSTYVAELVKNQII